MEAISKPSRPYNNPTPMIYMHDPNDDATSKTRFSSSNSSRSHDHGILDAKAVSASDICEVYLLPHHVPNDDKITILGRAAGRLGSRNC
jgi:hypothetical protein